MVTMDSEEVLRETNTPISRMVILMFQEGCDSFERASVIPSGVCFLCDHVSLWEEERKELTILTWHRSTHWHALNTRHDRCLKESTARGFTPSDVMRGACIWWRDRRGLRACAAWPLCHLVQKYARRWSAEDRRKSHGLQAKRLECET